MAHLKSLWPLLVLRWMQMLDYDATHIYGKYDLKKFFLLLFFFLLLQWY
jgi:hypothetical protein